MFAAGSNTMLPGWLVRVQHLCSLLIQTLHSWEVWGSHHYPYFTVEEASPRGGAQVIHCKPVTLWARTAGSHDPVGCHRTPASELRKR